MAYGYDEQEYRPLRGRALAETETFLARQGLTWERDVTYTVLLRDREGRLAATAATMLQILGLPQPAEMTGKSLIEA